MNIFNKEIIKFLQVNANAINALVALYITGE